MNGAEAKSRTIAVAGAEIRIFQQETDLVAFGADEFLACVARALSARGICNMALAGGTTPRKLYSLLAARAAATDWSRVHFFFGDERCVSPDNAESNYRMVRETLLASPALAAAHVHRVKAELPPAQAAKQYDEELRAHFAAPLPQFDLILLGMGPDGHTASLFPGSKALDERERWVTANWVEKFGASRITFTYPVLNNASEVMFLVTGAEKRGAVRQIFRESAALPAAGVKPIGKLLWLLDSEAGADF